jgi:acyl carrier protein
LGDSLAWVGLLSAVEDAFDLHIDTEQSLSLVTVGDLVRFVGEPTHA